MKKFGLQIIEMNSSRKLVDIKYFDSEEEAKSYLVEDVTCLTNCENYTFVKKTDKIIVISDVLTRSSIEYANFVEYKLLGMKMM